MAYKTTAVCLTFEIIFSVISLIIAVVVSHLMVFTVNGLQPFKRGFFCDDFTIKYPDIEKGKSTSFLDIIKAGVVTSLALVRLVVIGAL